MHGDPRTALIDDCVLNSFMNNVLSSFAAHLPVVFAVVARPGTQANFAWRAEIDNKTYIGSKKSWLAKKKATNFASPTIAWANKQSENSWKSRREENVSQWETFVRSKIQKYNFDDIFFAENRSCLTKTQRPCVIKVVDEVQKTYLETYFSNMLANRLNQEACLKRIEQYEEANKIAFDTVFQARIDLWWFGNLSRHVIQLIESAITVQGHKPKEDGLSEVKDHISTFPRKDAEQTIGWARHLCSTCSTSGYFDATKMVHSTYHRAPHLPEDFFERMHIDAALSSGAKIHRIQFPAALLRYTKQAQRQKCTAFFFPGTADECMNRLEHSCPQWRLAASDT